MFFVLTAAHLYCHLFYLSFAGRLHSSLSSKRRQHWCVLAFRCLHDLAPSYLSEIPVLHIQRSGRSSPTQIREYVNTRRTIHLSIHSRRPSVPRGCCTCLEFFATQCSVYIVAGFLSSASRDSHCSLRQLADTQLHILELSFCSVFCCDNVT